MLVVKGIYGSVYGIYEKIKTDHNVYRGDVYGSYTTYSWKRETLCICDGER